jgi:hypothetical protein
MTANRRRRMTRGATEGDADGYNPFTGQYWREGETGRKRGSKKPQASKRKRRQKKGK